MPPERNDTTNGAEPGTGSVGEKLGAAEAALSTDPSRALTLALDALGKAESPWAEARAKFLIGSAEYRQGRPKEALEPLLDAKERFSQLSDSSGMLDALLALVRVERDLGQLRVAARRCDEALTLSRSLCDPETEVDALNLRASVCDALGTYPQALECLEGALAIAREHHLKERQGNVLNNIGILHTLLGDHERALESLTAAYEVLREAAPGTRSEGSNLLSLGHLYREREDHSEARRLFMQALEVSRQAEDQVMEAVAINSLANVCSASGDWASARDLFGEALELARKLGMRQYEIDNVDGLGQVHAALEEYPQALEVHLQALEISREIGDREGEIDALLNLGRDYLAMARPGEALEPLQEGLILAQQIERKRSIYQAHQFLAEAFERTGDPLQALHHYREFHRVEKTVFNEESEQQTRRFAVQFDLERARHEAEKYRLRVEVTQQAREQAEAEVRERTQELQEAQLEIVTRLAVAAEHRDDETGEHTRRVGRNAAAIARALGWPEDEIALILAAAPLHDVGKIGIRDTVLLKPGKLTADEFELMRAHTTIGARILSGGQSRLLRMAEEIALAHHERWDGAGYPLGLAGDSIPMAARIVAVADVLDALTHARPYKSAWPIGQALAEIERQSGLQFDPKVAATCLQVFDLEWGISPLDAPSSQPIGNQLERQDYNRLLLADSSI